MKWSSACPLCEVICQASLLGWARWSTQHNGARVRPFHNINVWGARFNDFQNLMLNRNFGYLITKLRVHTHQVWRLCHIMWARKWHNNLPQSQSFTCSMHFPKNELTVHSNTLWTFRPADLTWCPELLTVIADLTWWNYLHIAEGPILASSLQHLGCQESGALCGASMVLLFKPLRSLLLLDLPVDLQAFRLWPWRQTSSVGPTALDLAPSLVIWLGSAKASCDCLVECCTVLTLAPVTAARGTALIRSACMLNSCSANLQLREQKMLLLLEKRPLVASFKSLVHFAQLGVAWSETGSCKLLLLLLQEALRIIFDLGLGQ
jgi:hypothetical protein